MTRWFFLALVAAILPAAARADRIHLHNGKSFEDVVLISQKEGQVRFRLASGEMSLPLSWVARVEKAPGALEEYLGRRQRLAEDPASSGGSWLALARWARSRGVDHGFREAALMAGELEPNLEGLPPLMAMLGYYLHPTTGVWAPGRPDTVASVRSQREPARTSEVVAESGERRDQRVAEGLTRAIATLAEAELQRTRATSSGSGLLRTRPLTTAFYPLVSTPVAVAGAGWFFPGVPLRPADSDPRDPVIRRPANPEARALLSRPPGSILPLSAYRH